MYISLVSCIELLYTYLHCFIVACEKGLYGSNCVGSCGHCQGNKACEHVNGSCRNGHCEPGWKHTSEWKCDQGICR